MQLQFYKKYQKNKIEPNTALEKWTLFVTNAFSLFADNHLELKQTPFLGPPQDRWVNSGTRYVAKTEIIKHISQPYSYFPIGFRRRVKKGCYNLQWVTSGGVSQHFKVSSFNPNGALSLRRSFKTPRASILKPFCLPSTVLNVSVNSFVAKWSLIAIRASRAD